MANECHAEIIGEPEYAGVIQLAGITVGGGGQSAELEVFFEGSAVQGGSRNVEILTHSSITVENRTNGPSDTSVGGFLKY